MFYSKSTGGFYDESIHGHRKLTIIQPGWQHPQIEVKSYHFDPEAPLDAPTVFMDDPDVTPPTIEIDNPACLIPADAVEITAEEHAALLAGQATGKLIVANAAGRPELQDPPALTHAQLVAQTLGRTREERQPIISVLDGLQSSALTKGDSGAAQTIEAVKQGLRDITKTDLSACTTADEMRAEIMAAYAALVTANPSVATAFKGVIA